MIKKHESKRLQESYYSMTLDSGFTMILYPKKDSYQMGAYLSVGYGSLFTTFVNREGIKREHPHGTAHFLEHKLFESKTKNIFDQMGFLGADVNAFTAHDNTCFYFNTIENFEESLKLLLKVPELREYTAEGIEKERPIIHREIEMYQDNPDYAAYHHALNSLYPNHPIGQDIAGTHESIEDITKEVLDEVLESFYIPSNMFLFVIGDFNQNKLLEIEAMLPSFYSSYKEPVQVVLEEDRSIPSDNYKEIDSDVSIPSFSYVLKMDPIKDAHLNFRRMVKYTILLDVLFGESSVFFKEHYDRGELLDSDVSYSFGPHYRFLSLSFEGDAPRTIYESIRTILSEPLEERITPIEMELIKRQHLGHYLMSFNSLGAIAMTYISFHYQGVDIFDYIDLVESINIDDFKNLFNGVEFFSVIKKEA